MDIYFLQLTPQHYIHGSLEALKRYHRGQGITRCSGRAGRACSFEPEDVQDVRVRPSLCLRAGAAMQSAGDADALLPASFDGTLLLAGFQVASSKTLKQRCTGPAYASIRAAHCSFQVRGGTTAPCHHLRRGHHYGHHYGHHLRCVHQCDEYTHSSLLGRHNSAGPELGAEWRDGVC